MIYCIERYSYDRGISRSGRIGWKISYHGYRSKNRTLYHDWRSKSNDDQFCKILAKSSKSGNSTREKKEVLNEVFNDV
jgi:hypothetical protein